MKFTFALAVHFAAAVSAITTAPVTFETPAPVTSPGYPPCQVCGAGKVVTIRDAILSSLPGTDPLSCEELQIQGLTGYIEEQYCPNIASLISECGCAEDDFAPPSAPVSSTAAPVTFAPAPAVTSVPPGTSAPVTSPGYPPCLPSLWCWQGSYYPRCNSQHPPWH
jgi:hypothetical protein